MLSPRAYRAALLEQLASTGDRRSSTRDNYNSNSHTSHPSCREDGIDIKFPKRRASGSDRPPSFRFSESSYSRSNSQQQQQSQQGYSGGAHNGQFVDESQNLCYLGADSSEQPKTGSYVVQDSVVSDNRGPPLSRPAPSSLSSQTFLVERQHSMIVDFIDTCVAHDVDDDVIAKHVRFMVHAMQESIDMHAALHAKHHRDRIREYEIGQLTTTLERQENALREAESKLQNNNNDYNSHRIESPEVDRILGRHHYERTPHGKTAAETTTATTTWGPTTSDHRTAMMGGSRVSPRRQTSPPRTEAMVNNSTTISPLRYGRAAVHLMRMTPPRQGGQAPQRRAPDPPLDDAVSSRTAGGGHRCCTYRECEYEQQRHHATTATTHVASRRAQQVVQQRHQDAARRSNSSSSRFMQPTHASAARRHSHSTISTSQEGTATSSGRDSSTARTKHYSVDPARPTRSSQLRQEAAARRRGSFSRLTSPAMDDDVAVQRPTSETEEAKKDYRVSPQTRRGIAATRRIRRSNDSDAEEDALVATAVLTESGSGSGGSGGGGCSPAAHMPQEKLSIDRHNSSGSAPPPGFNSHSNRSNTPKPPLYYMPGSTTAAADSVIMKDNSIGLNSSLYLDSSSRSTLLAGAPSSSKSQQVHLTSPELQLFIEMSQRKMREADRVLERALPPTSSSSSFLSSAHHQQHSSSAVIMSGSHTQDYASTTVGASAAATFDVQTPQAVPRPQDGAAEQQHSPMVEISPASDDGSPQ